VSVLAVGVSLLALVATLLGGWVVLRFRALPGELLAFSAGTLIGVGALDLVPHGLMRLGGLALLGLAAGYGALLVWNRAVNPLTLPHSHGQFDPDDTVSHTDSGLIAAVALLLHKLFDGAVLGIGLADDNGFWLGVAAALVLHSFCDGINTVTLVLRTGRDRLLAGLFLTANGFAPLIGALAVMALDLQPLAVDWLVMVVAGMFVYVAIHDLLPAALQRGDQRLCLGSLVGGVAFTWGLIGVLG